LDHRGHTKHRPTKEKFYPATYASGGSVAAKGAFNGPDIDGTNEYGYVNCYIPKDYDGMEEIMLVFIANVTASPMHMRIVTDYCQAGEAYFEHNENVNLSVNTVQNRMTELNLVNAVDTAPLEPGDYLGIQVSRVATLPTENTDIILIGVRIKYKQQ